LKALMKNILIVDDTLDSLQILYYLLRKQNHTVRMAGDGMEALHYLESYPVDMLITDINMPFMDGLTLLERIRSDRRFKKLPVILVTASARENFEQLAVQKGASGFLTQPFSSGDFNALVTNLFEQSANRSQDHRPY
jgi:CheY-like chemotaxis protein